MKNKFFFLLLLCSIAVVGSAENKWTHITQRNELRIGWGDQLFESLIWHNPTSIITTMPDSYQQVYKENYSYNQHVWMEYQWRFTHWFSLGAMVDFSHVGWDEVTRNGKGAELNRKEEQFFYNAVIMPTIRFTYFHHENVNFYSGLGVGLDINGGTETNALGNHTDVGAAINLTVFGISANYQRWFWTVDCGGLYALKNMNTIFLMSSRIVNVGMGVRF
ncbi:MAG: hypothetical protein UIB40_01750 [Paludibacteraceae bacterium]|nr:hypothetical protein [Paludibacteraceae bacterium]